MNRNGKQAGNKLSIAPDDIEAMVKHPDREIRAVKAQKICRQIRTLKLSKTEQLVVDKILQFIIKDSAAMVRRALAVTLKNSPNLPHDIAKKLISDIDSIAVPVLECSPVLTDDDLLEILKSRAARKMLAITKRPRITGRLVKAIIRTGESHLVANIAANDGAEIGAELGSEMLEIYHNDDLIKNSMIARSDLPIVLVEKLVTMVSADMAKTLRQKYNLSDEQALDIAKRANERAQARLARRHEKTARAELIESMMQEGRLTSSFVLRMAGAGQIDFTCMALAVRAGISERKAVLMLFDEGPFALKALCRQAGLNAVETSMIQACIAIFKDLEGTGIVSDSKTFTTRMIERVLSLPIAISRQEQDYLLEKLDALGSDLFTFVSKDRQMIQT